MNTFWINDISILFNKNKLLEVIPTSNMKINDKLNAVFRLSIYYFIIITIIKKNINNIFIPVLVGIVTILIYNNYKKINNIETVDEDVQNNYTESNEKSENDLTCRLPTKENPFMNPTQLDISNGDMQQACPSYDNSVIRELEDINFKRGLYMDTNDIYNNQNSQREFYTLPVSGIINDQGSFAEWCYGRAASCKERNGIQCKSNI